MQISYHVRSGLWPNKSIILSLAALVQVPPLPAASRSATWGQRSRLDFCQKPIYATKLDCSVRAVANTKTSIKRLARHLPAAVSSHLKCRRWHLFQLYSKRSPCPRSGEREEAGQRSPRPLHRKCSSVSRHNPSPHL